MAFNLQTFKTRALSAVVFVIVMLFGLLWNHWSFFILFSIIHFGCWMEYQKLVAKIDPGYGNISSLHKYGVMLAGWGFMLWMTNEAYSFSEFRLEDAGFWMLVVGAVAVNAEVLFTRKFKLLAHSLLGFVYISISLGCLIDIGNCIVYCEDQRPTVEYVLVIIASIWINDTMAYIVGSLIGKTPLSKISPKKTWEGTIGGAILAMIVVPLLVYFLNPFIRWDICLGIAAIASIFGTLGDLFESKLKRLAGVKDSGSMMPGHGGFLDRFDSLLLATPIVWLYLTLLAAF